MKTKRVKTPRVIQMEAIECGAASLSIILGYYGKFVSLEELRVECGVSRDGSKAYDILEAAKKYGLEGEGQKLDAEELKEASYPAILFWEFRHFLVLEGVVKDTVYLNDPAAGRRQIHFDDFKKSYSGVALLFEKTDRFQKGGSFPSIWDMLKTRLNGALLSLFYLLILGFCLLLPGFVIPALLIFFLQNYFSDSLISSSFTFLTIGLSSAAFAYGATLLQGKIARRLNTFLSIRLTSHFLWHLLHLPIQFYLQRYPGEIAYRLILHDQILKTITGPILSSVLNLILILFYGVVLLSYDLSIAAIGIGGALFCLLSMASIFKSRANLYACMQQDVAKFVSESINGIQSIESIKVRGVETAFFSRWAGEFTKNINAKSEIGQKDALLSALPPLFQQLSLAALLGIGSFKILQGDMNIASLMGMQLILTSFLQPINRFVSLSATIQNLSTDLSRLDDVIKNPIDPFYEQKESVSFKETKLKGEIEFKNVSFSYSPRSPLVIDNLSFHIKPGQRFAFVGSTGCGKSTIAKLISQLVLPTSGQILVDGVDIKEIPKECFTSSFAMVDQEIFLFDGTVRENVALWNMKIPDEILTKAATDAAIFEEIMLRSKGFDSHVSEGGRNWSGGQRQRLEIARAFLYSPSLILLDEATSALDSYTELQVAENVRRRGCTAILIAHRLSSIRDCDQIIVLDKGKIVDQGTHEELKERDGMYKMFVKEGSLE